jgi:AcrR family transcriptional regulator
MSTEERQEAIAVATTPLLAEHGTHVTTGQIAKAAGVAEGTIFRVFKDKQELLDFCVLRAFRTQELVKQITAIEANGPLTERLVAVMTMVDEMAARVGALMHALGATGYRHDNSKFEKADTKSTPPQVAEFERVSVAISKLLMVGPDELRLPADRAAGYLLGLTFVSRMQAGRTNKTESSVEEIIDLFINGAIASTAPRGGSNPQ